MRWSFAALGLILLVGCGSKKPSTVDGAPKVPPDESYQVDSIGSKEGFLWTCTPSTAGTEHVHMWRSCGEMIGCGKWQLERGACGTSLANEPPASGRHKMHYGVWE